jgi:hypothetical protein
MAAVLGMALLEIAGMSKHFGKIAATPRTVERLHRLADALDFPRTELFLD